MAKLKIENGKLVVPNNITIPYIAGDGVGAEISPVTQSIIDTAVKKCYAGERKIEWLLPEKKPLNKQAHGFRKRP